MVDLQKRKSRANWATKGKPGSSFQPQPFPGQKSSFAPQSNSARPPASHLPSPFESTPSQQRINQARQNSIPSHGSGNGNGIASDLPIPGPPTGRAQRRFSVKLNHQEAMNVIGKQGSGAPSLPYNATSLIKDASMTANDSSVIAEEDEEQEPFSVQLTRENYDAPKYVKGQLSSANATAIDKFANELQEMSNNNNLQVKKAINQSYKQVLQVSNEIINTESTLKVLKVSVNKLTDVLTQQIEEAQEVLEYENEKKQQSVPGSKRKAANRTSVMLLEKKWASGLSSIFKEIQNSQKYISAAPGRHVIEQSRRWYELNAITWKPIRPAHIVILNDHVLLANRTKVKVGNVESKRTVATQCHPIRDISLSEAKIEENSYTISFRTKGDLNFLYQTDSLAEFKKIQGAFLQAKNEFNNTLENEKHQQREFRNSINRLSVQDGLNRNSDIIQGLTNKYHSRSISRDFKEQNISGKIETIEEDLMNLNIVIGYSKYEQSVGFVKRLYDLIDELMSKPTIDDSLKILLHVKRLETDYLNGLLIKKLSYEISNPRIEDSKLENIIQLFQILEIENKAREVFLSSKSIEINDVVSKVEFQGDIKAYIDQLSIIFFSMISKTAALFERFLQNKIYLIDWVTNEVQTYIDLFKRQLLDVDPKSKTYQECLRVTTRQAEQLNSLGINVEHLLLQI